MSADTYRSYTPSERRQRARAVFGGVRQAVADAETKRYEKTIDRIDAAAEERGARELASMRRQLDTSRDAVAAAKTALRTADRSGRDAAKRSLRTAEDSLRRTERAARKLGL
ncbi:hypothetical protein [Streptomyces sp. IB2014 016-6]|uniref:hypothetical protein n=1 Tax=Streptomyces sp. IB2014 016-6 TaxID=2517818 RepID=UPI0011CC72BA|nr:hypothetical protein [Streptomyces sp. IB2014 016-6]TXL86890.1 hypothetical protein EW053_24900 [Streptomyces sp. IB2014 016-6]